MIKTTKYDTAEQFAGLLSVFFPESQVHNLEGLIALIRERDALIWHAAQEELNAIGDFLDEAINV